MKRRAADPMDVADLDNVAELALERCCSFFLRIAERAWKHCRSSRCILVR